MKWISNVVTAAIFTTISINSLPVFAHGPLSKPLYGGVVVKVDPLEIELVATATTITLHVVDHGKPLDTKGVTAKLTLLSGTDKFDVVVLPAGDNRLAASGTFNVKKGTRVVGVVAVAGAKPLSMRWVLP